MGNEIIIWTEGGPKLGMGHVVRCVNLATALGKSASKPSFIINQDESTQKRLLMEGFTYVLNALDADIIEPTLNLLRGVKVIVIDTKRDVTKAVKLLSMKGIKIVLIDNSTNAANFADLVIIPSIHSLPEGLDIESDKLFSGPDFLSVGESFSKLRAESSHAYAIPLRVLVTCGGADPNDITSLVVGALCDMDDIDVTVVIGSAFTRRDPYVVAAGCKHVRCVSGLTDLAPLMSEAHVAFTANGTSIYELAFMGVPTVVIANYESDLRELNAYNRLGFSTGLGLFSTVTPDKIRSALARYADKDYFESCREKALALTDGLGTKRTAELIVSLHDNL